MTKCWGWLLVIQISIAGSAIAQSGSDQPNTDQPRPGTGRGPIEQPQPASEPKPLSLFATVSNGLASNINFDDDEIRSIGLVLGGGAQYVGDDFDVRYELAGHSYTNTSRWDRLSQRIEAAFERDLPGNWEFETVGQIGFKGSSEDRDLVDQDFEITPRFDYRFTPERRLRLFTAHRLKRYDDSPETNALKHYAGAEFREVMAPRRHWEVGGRVETNDEREDRGDYLRWTYWLEHGIPLTRSDALVMQIRYRIKRYTYRMVEVEDEDVQRLDHRWVPSIRWVRSLGPRYEVSFDYTYESNYSNDPEREYGAHLAWTSFGVRW